MQLMEDKILAEGKVLPGGILKVGSFLNQQIDTDFLAKVGAEIAGLFAGSGVTKVLTIESSGIAIAAAAGMALFKWFSVMSGTALKKSSYLIFRGYTL